SNNLTGNSQLGGDWDLEIATGAIEASLAISPEAQNSFDAVLVSYEGKEYQLTSQSLSWEQAQAEAVSLGGNLVTINNGAEETWLKQTFGSSERLWIGLNDRNEEGNFQWVNGETTSYRNWAAGEPNDYKFRGAFTAGEDYAQMNWGRTGQWNDMPNSYAGTFRGIIELVSDNSPGVIGLETSIYQVNESDTSVDVTILRSDGSNGVVSIDYATINATASAGDDYAASSGTITFADGETSKTVTIPIIDDDVVEGNENFGFTIDNIVGGATLLAPRTALITIVDDETGLESVIDFDDFASTTGLTLNGNASQASSAIRLTPTAEYQAGSVYFNRPLAFDTDTSFETQFQFQLSGGSGGADGFTFMLQNISQALNFLGDSGGRLGYSTTTSDITQSLAIEFDTYQNGWDINNNHISVLRDGDIANALTTVAAPLDLNSGDLLNAWVDYDGNTNLLEVSLANTANKPDTALLSFEIDLASVLGSQAFLGFSAATGGLVNNHDIRSWQVASNSNLLAAPPASVSLNSETIISGLNQPTAIEWTPNGDRFFVAEKGGIIKVAENGSLNSTPFIDLSAQVNGTRDRGLLDIAVHPDFFNGSPYVYALYTYDPPEVFQNSGLAGEDGNGNRAARLTRITADASNGYRTAIPGSEVVILGQNSTWSNFNAFANSTNDFNEPAAGILPDGTNLPDFLAADSESHTIGSVEFGIDGALYVTNGDGTSYNRVDPRTVRVQDIDNLSGKVLRIDPITGAGLADNPFYNGDRNANRSKVYQLGLRNPFRMTIDPRNGDVYVGDVGWTQWEEINSAGAGANFGWPYYEGGSGNNIRTGGYRDLPEAQAAYNSNLSFEPSILALNHGTDGINAIVLGDIYTGNAFPQQYQGDLFFNDLGRGIVRNVSFDESGNVTSVDTFATGANVVVQIIEAPDGSLYYVDLDDGIVGRWFFR
ncbi:MAG: PQQ-dependent sugar dehydrogenase, partial [Cyanobacteria bacterium P01_C01_bin.72]